MFLNLFCDPQTLPLWGGEDKIILPNPNEINIGGPVQIEDTAGGFFINKANQKTIAEISKDIETQITAIREQKKVWEEGDTLLKTPVLLLSSVGTLGPVEFDGGAFPQTNTCVLGPRAILEKPAVRNGKIVIRKMMNVGLSWDHRAMDANIPIEFLTQLKKNLGEPYTYLI
jgi:Pyruvate/2-oxoglutarate dehydrogenase complex, dihydrolipoamide acyltransferase (E2) component, and related enzymes